MYNNNNNKSKINFKTKKFNGKFNKTNKFKNKFNKKPNENEEIEKIKSTNFENFNPKEINKFSDFPISWKTLKGLTQNGFKVPTDIQRESIGYALQGKDILGAAVTGSGKTLAFLIPILENLFIKKWYRTDGVGAIIISPTRELAYQIFETLRKVGAFHDFSAGLIIGGKNLKFERNRMDQCNIIICTPGRLLQHMDENPLFNCDSMQVLVLDEADRCLDMGFEQTMNGIIENLPSEKQTLLFSATQTKSVRDLARLSLKNPTYVAPHEQQATVPSTLKQNYVIVELENKITMLWSFIKNHLKQKSIIFLSSCKQVKFIYEMFCKLRPGTSLLALYGTLHQDRRVAIYEEFCRKSNVVLFATDIASRGLDFPIVNWVIQLDCPEDAIQYIHRAGRTARHNAKGESLLVLMPSEEEGMLEELKTKNIIINKIMIDSRKMFSPRAKMEAFLAANTELKETAQRAFVAYIKSVFLMKNKKIFNVDKFNVEEFANSLGLIVTPRVRFLERIKKKQLSKPSKKLTQISVKVENSDISDENCNDSRNLTIKEESNSETEIQVKNIWDFNISDDSGDENLFQLKRRDHQVDAKNDELKDSNLEEIKKRTKKATTKASLAKRVLNKKIVINTKLQFDDDGEEIINPIKNLQSDIGKKYLKDDNEGGIDINKVKIVLQEEDKFDKERFKELVKIKNKTKKAKTKKQKEKLDTFSSDEETEDEGPDLSWLPNPDEIYGECDTDFEDEKYHKPSGLLFEKPINKRLLEQQENFSESSSNESETFEPANKKTKKMTNKLSVNEAEIIAMQLLAQ